MWHFSSVHTHSNEWSLSSYLTLFTHFISGRVYMKASETESSGSLLVTVTAHNHDDPPRLVAEYVYNDETAV